MALPVDADVTEAPTQPRSAWIVLAKLAVSVLLVVWVLRSVDVARIAHSLVALGPASVLAAMLLMVVQYGLLAWRWQRVIAYLGDSLPLGTAVRWTFFGLFFSQVLPSSMGGDAVRIWLLHRRGTGAGVALSSVVVERMTGLALLCLFVSASALWPWWREEHRAVVGPLLALGPIACAALGLLACAGPIVSTRRLPRWLGGVGVVVQDWHRVATRPRALVEIAALGVSASFVGLSAVFVLSRSLGIELGLLQCFALAGGALLLTVLPISIGGWGVREASMVGLFGSFGVPPEPVLALSVAYGLLPLLVSIPAGLLGVFEPGAVANPARNRGRTGRWAERLRTFLQIKK